MTSRAIIFCLLVFGLNAVATEAPAARALSIEKLQAWYGESIDFKNDAQLAKNVQAAEVILASMFGGDIASRIPKEKELAALALPAMTVRAIVRYGRIMPLDAKKGIISADAPVAGFKDKTVKVTARIPDAYTPDKAWPVIIALHGAHGDGPSYMEHWIHGPGASAAEKYIILAPSADKSYGWGPASFGRSQAIGALDWLMANYRIDADRVYLEGTSMGGYGVKRLATLWPDRFAAISPRSGPPFSPTQMATLHNLHACPMLSFAGEEDKLIPVKAFNDERDQIKAYEIPAEVNILPGRGHETYQDKDPEAVAFFEKNPRNRAPGTLVLDSVEDGQGLRHYYVEIIDTDTRGNQEAGEIVINSTKGDDSIIRQMQAAKDFAQYQSLLKQAMDKGVLLENRKTWVKPREVKLHVDRSNNAIVIDKTGFVRSLRIYLDDDIVDMSKDVIIKSGERVLLKRKVDRSTHFMLDEMMKSGRRDMTYWGVLEVRL